MKSIVALLALASIALVATLPVAIAADVDGCVPGPKPATAADYPGVGVTIKQSSPGEACIGGVPTDSTKVVIYCTVSQDGEPGFHYCGAGICKSLDYFRITSGYQSGNQYCIKANNEHGQNARYFQLYGYRK